MSATPLLERIAFAPISWGVIEVPSWGVQLDRQRVLDEMLMLGVTATEFGPDGFLPNSPQERAAVLAEKGLRAVGGFFPIVLHLEDQDPLPAIEQELEAYAAAGADTLVLSAITDREGYDVVAELNEEEWATLLANLDRARETADARGVRAALHPHVGTAVETPGAVDRVLAGSSIGICFDTGHYTLGGGDPVQFVRDHADRIVHVHLKDVALDVAAKVRSGSFNYRDGVRRGMYQPLGQGDAHVREIVEILGESGFSGWYVLEQDTVIENDADAVKALENARQSLNFLLEQDA